MVGNPVEVTVNESVGRVHMTGHSILSILCSSDVILKGKRKLAEVIDHSRGHTDKLVEVMETIAADVYVAGAGLSRMSSVLIESR